MSELPEGCITHIVSFASPRDACILTLVSSTFKSAADSDVVWEKFLPSDYKDLIARAVPPMNLDDFSSKKELYFHLSNVPILLDGGVKSFNLEKETGKKCFFLGARELTIVWSDTPQYWEWLQLPDSRFGEVAHLHAVCWLEIIGKIDTKVLSPKTTYAVYLVFDVVEGGFHGFEYPIEVSVKFIEGEGTSSGVRTVRLEDDEGNQLLDCIPRNDKWIEIELGEFYNDLGADGVVEMSMKEVKCLGWKTGLAVVGIEIRPKRIAS